MIETFTDGLASRIHHLAAQCMREACARSLKLAVAESCTGGLLAAVMTDVEGDAHAFERGFVTYTDEAKIEQLDVPSQTIDLYTAVSVQTADAMARGVLAHSAADLGLSITGFAGPGAPGEEPGLVYFGVANRHGDVRVITRRFEPSTRTAVRIASLQTSLELLLQAMEGWRDT
jgi:nicotinamide-nucleotide amidase